MNIKCTLLTLVLFIFSTIQAQKTYIPDNAFEQVLIDQGFDNNLDDSVLTANIDTITTFHFSYVDVESLEGINDFISLKKLTFWGTKVSELNISNHPSLEYIEAVDDSLISIDLSNNQSLSYLFCKGEKLNQLNVSNCMSLSNLRCEDSKVSTINLSTCPSITDLSLINNNLSYLNVANGYNSDIVYFRAHDNPNLTCIQVDDPVYSDTTWLYFTYSFDSIAVFSEDCGEPLSISDNETTLNYISLYPNPTSGLLHLESEYKSTYRLYSILRQNVLQSGHLYEGLNTIDISYLNPGIYTLVLTLKNGNTITKKIIKQE